MTFPRLRPILRAARPVAAALAAASLVAACAGEAPEPLAPADPAAIFVPTPGVALSVLETPTAPPLEEPPAHAPAPPAPSDWVLEVMTADGAPVAGATVRVADLAVTTDEDGVATLYGLERGTYVARVDAPGLATASVAARLGSGVIVATDVRLLPEGGDVAIKASTWTVLKAEGLTVTVPPGAFEDAEGEIAMGELTAHLTVLDPTSARSFALPARLLGVEKPGAEPLALAPIALVRVVAHRGDEALRLRDGVDLAVSVDAPTDLVPALQGARPDGAWRLDAEAGLWRREPGSAVVREEGEDGRLHLETRVGDGWWGLFWPWKDAAFDCVHVHARSALAGTPLPGAAVQAWGPAAPVPGVAPDHPTYVGFLSQGTTDVFGDACLPIPRTADARVAARHALLPFQPDGPAAVRGNGLEGHLDLVAGDDRRADEDAPMALGACVKADIALAAPVCVQGTVRDERGEPLADEPVSVRWETGFGPVETGSVTNADGVWQAAAWGHHVTAEAPALPTVDGGAAVLSGNAAILGAGRRGECVEVPPLVVPFLDEPR